MKVIYGIGNRNLRLGHTAAAIGIFDGVHRGHRLLISRMQKAARRLKAKSMVITFFPHPAHVLRPDVRLPYVMSLPQRLKTLEALGVDICVVIRFEKRFAAIDPTVFIKDVLVKRLGVKAVFVGTDFRFGKNRSGDIALFESMAKDGGYEMHAVNALTNAGQPISSTRIRALLAEGKIAQAKRLLGAPVTLTGVVVKGDGRGKKLGFPTANIHCDTDVLVPNGVYAVEMVIAGKIYPGVANIGIRPSFRTKNPRVHVEVHLFDFKRNIYGKPIEVHLLKKLRNERTFPNPQALITQITKDTQTARTYFKAK